nr:MAG TPA: portal protein [Caudoviricetes sp.]
MAFTDRLQHAWNAFIGRNVAPINIGYGSTRNPGMAQFTRENARSIISPIYTRIAVDVSSLTVQHARLDVNGRFKEAMPSALNECFTVQANIDQTGRAFMQDIVMSMLDEGVVAVVPVETEDDPTIKNSFDITNLRTGKILEWYPQHVKVRLYNEQTGLKEDITLPKKMVAIIENPFYSVMNEPNSTMQRLRKKLLMIDAIDEQNSSGKLNMIIQLPYIVKSQGRLDQATKRREQIENQLVNSQHGIAYIDGTEKVIQLNRAVENNLLEQIQYLTDQLYNQLGMPKGVFDGTADEQTMINYQTRTIEPIASAIINEMERKFLTKTARTRGQAIMFFNDPFKLVPVSQMAEIADKFTRNEILSSNEIRQIIGYKPANDPQADELRNKNLNQSADAKPAAVPVDDEGNDEGVSQNETKKV